MGMRLSDRRKSMYKVMETGSDDGGTIQERLSALQLSESVLCNTDTCKSMTRLSLISACFPLFITSDFIYKHCFFFNTVLFDVAMPSG